jgi:hypothetical protein
MYKVRVHQVNFVEILFIFKTNQGDGNSSIKLWLSQHKQL